MEEFAKRLRELRKDNGLTLLQLENATNISKSTLNDWENEKSIPNALGVVILAKFFDVSTDYLLGLSEI